MTDLLIPDAVVFDLDDLLVATSGAWDHAYAALAACHGGQFSRDERKQLAAQPFQRLGHALAALLHSPARPDELLAQLVHLLGTNGGRPVAPMPGAMELVTALSVSYPLAVATNSPTAVACQHLTSIGLIDRFTVVVGVDEVNRPKPAPDVYERAAKQLRTRPARSVALEDSQIGLDAAKAAGYGYLVGVAHQGQRLRADAVYPSLADLQLWRLFGVAPVL